MTRRVATLLATTLLVTSPAAASEMVDFAKCLRSAGATYYTASWCPHCRRQDQMFGNALGYLRSVDCTDGCDQVKSYPTWTFKNGSRISGVATLQILASRTGCSLGGPDDAGDAEPASAPTEGAANERFIGGAKIIEVPRR